MLEESFIILWGQVDTTELDLHRARSLITDIVCVCVCVQACACVLIREPHWSMKVIICVDVIPEM